VKQAHAPAARAVCVAAIAAFLLLGAAWALDRSHRWDAPRLDTSSFVRIRGAPSVSSDRPMSLVPINPACPSCMKRARELSGGPRSERLVFLIVDRPSPPPPLALSELEADAIWWDARGIWRHRWGHRVYGEILRFDPRGRYRGTTPPRFAPDEQGGEER
jgi:hypothetical protein